MNHYVIDKSSHTWLVGHIADNPRNAIGWLGLLILHALCRTRPILLWYKIIILIHCAFDFTLIFRIIITIGSGTVVPSMTTMVSKYGKTVSCFDDTLFYNNNIIIIVIIIKNLLQAREMRKERLWGYFGRLVPSLEPLDHFSLAQVNLIN